MKVDTTQSFKVTKKTKCRKFLATGDFNVWLSGSEGVTIHCINFTQHPNYDCVINVVFEDK